ncbi:unnamed protein product [Heligmosomoides polygyrus]|uniref:Helicase ATP-binding domain-containing protein n=1 Tax=Heligmosomoides polygyrus TaxID=6339 RepID=A0A3P8DY86_HELPZ|nr:unnamed protein product [Heligmosomoides polygyrus]
MKLRKFNEPELTVLLGNAFRRKKYDATLPLRFLLPDVVPNASESEQLLPSYAMAVGENSSFTLGLAADGPVREARKVSLEGVKKVSMSNSHTLFLTQKGEVYACGQASNFDTGEDNGSLIVNPIKIEFRGESLPIVDLAAGPNHSIFITSKSVYVCGLNRNFCIGQRNENCQYSMKKMKLPTHESIKKVLFYKVFTNADCTIVFSSFQSETDMWIVGKTPCKTYETFTRIEREVGVFEIIRSNNNVLSMSSELVNVVMIAIPIVLPVCVVTLSYKRRSPRKIEVTISNTAGVLNFAFDPSSGRLPFEPCIISINGVLVDFFCTDYFITKQGDVFLMGSPENCREGGFTLYRGKAVVIGDRVEEDGFTSAYARQSDISALRLLLLLQYEKLNEEREHACLDRIELDFHIYETDGQCMSTFGSIIRSRFPNIDKFRRSEDSVWIEDLSISEPSHEENKRASWHHFRTDDVIDLLLGGDAEDPSSVQALLEYLNNDAITMQGGYRLQGYPRKVPEPDLVKGIRSRLLEREQSKAAKRSRKKSTRLHGLVETSLPAVKSAPSSTVVASPLKPSLAEIIKEEEHRLLEGTRRLSRPLHFIEDEERAIEELTQLYRDNVGDEVIVSVERCAVSSYPPFREPNRRCVVHRRPVPRLAAVGANETQPIRLSSEIRESLEIGANEKRAVPQFLLEDAFETQTPLRIVCTQPRRLPAIAVASRVARERGEALGSTVGYHIRLEQRTSPQTVLTYCTSGVLLRMLTQDDAARDISHIILDEIHEREQNTDYLLIALKQALKKRNDLKVILMSATMEGNLKLFTKYFGEKVEVKHVDIATWGGSMDQSFPGVMHSHPDVVDLPSEDLDPETLEQFRQMGFPNNEDMSSTVPYGAEWRAGEGDVPAQWHHTRRFCHAEDAEAKPLLAAVDIKESVAVHHGLDVQSYTTMPSATYQQGALQSWDAQVVYNSQPPFQKMYMKCGGQQWAEAVDLDLAMAVVKYCMDSTVDGSVISLLLSLSVELVGRIVNIQQADADWIVSIRVSRKYLQKTSQYSRLFLECSEDFLMLYKDTILLYLHNKSSSVFLAYFTVRRPNCLPILDTYSFTSLNLDTPLHKPIETCVTVKLLLYGLCIAGSKASEAATGVSKMSLALVDRQRYLWMN